MTVTTTAAATTNETFDVGLLRKGLFVGISFISSRKGMKNRAPKEELEAEFRELNDYALPKDMRQELGNLIARRQYLYSRYSIPIESMKGHFVPNDNLSEFLEKAALLERDVKQFAEKIVERRPEINERLSQFSAKYGGMEPIHDDPEYIRREYGKFTVRINSVTIATSDFLGSMPELREKMRSELMEQVNRNAKELEARIRGEVAADLKKRVAAFLNRLAELKRKAEKEGKGLHGNTVKGLTEDIQRLSALTSVDPELSSLMGAVKGFASALLIEDAAGKSKGKGATGTPKIGGSNPAYIEAFREFASHMGKSAGVGGTRRTTKQPGHETDRELLAALSQVAGIASKGPS